MLECCYLFCKLVNLFFKSNNQNLICMLRANPSCKFCFMYSGIVNLAGWSRSNFYAHDKCL